MFMLTMGAPRRLLRFARSLSPFSRPILKHYIDYAIDTHLARRMEDLTKDPSSVHDTNLDALP